MDFKLFASILLEHLLNNQIAPAMSGAFQLIKTRTFRGQKYSQHLGPPAKKERKRKKQKQTNKQKTVKNVLITDKTLSGVVIAMGQREGQVKVMGQGE